MPNQARKYKCPFCQTLRAVRRNGDLRDHIDYNDEARRGNCRGSGLTVMDDHRSSDEKLLEKYRGD